MDARTRVRRLYQGRGPGGHRFLYGSVLFDLAVVLFFAVVTFLPGGGWILWVDLGVALVLLLDLAARIWSAERRWPAALTFGTLLDMVVIGSLLMPWLVESFAFLRVLRALRLIRSYHGLRLLCRLSPWFRRNHEVIVSVLNLAVFLFIITAVVYATQHRRNPEIGNYLDALYFTVTTLTTTGFGDITLEGSFGRLLSVVIMVVGIGLFVRLAQVIFRPSKVHHECPVCGLTRHDPDAVHCKHCGTTLHIPTEGEI